MATEIDTFFVPAADFANVIERASVSGTAANGPDVAGGYIPIVGIKLPEITIAEPDAFVLAQWSVDAGPNGGDLVFTISALPNRNGKPITKFQYALDGDQGSPTWVDLPAGTTVGSYTASGVSAATYTDVIALQAVNAIGGGGVSDLKSATVEAEPTVTSDDFSAGALGPEWSIPAGSSNQGGWSFGNDGTQFWLRSSLTQGEFYSNNGARVMQAAALTDADFPMVLMRVAGEAGGGSTAYRYYGLRVEQDDSNYFEAFLSRHSQHYASGENVVAGTDIGVPEVQTALGTATGPLGIRIDKNGDDWTFEYTMNGTDWTQYHSFTRAMTIVSFGIVHGTFNFLDHVVDFDYFELASDPITSEDA